MESKTLWTRLDGRKSKREAVLIGKQISPEWLSGTVNISQIRLTGTMKQSFGDLNEAAKQAKVNLPVVSLRAALICRLDNVVTLDKDLGLVAAKNGSYPCAVELYSPADEDLPEVRESLAHVLKRWIMDDVETWAEKYRFGHLVKRLREAVSPAAFEVTAIQAPYLRGNAEPDFRLIARSIGERLIGEELFDGLGSCELVASPEYGDNSVELMSLPRRGSHRDETFSMVARLTVATVPYNKNLYLCVSAMKRVWANRLPTASFVTPFRVTGYVIAAGRPITKVSVVNGATGWEFGEEYATLMRESEDRLPPSLSEAIARREYSVETGWWSGLPELPSLFRHVAPRTAFEGDEVSLLETIARLLTPLVGEKPIPFKEIKLPRLQAKPLQEMLRLSDFGVAGAIFSAEPDNDDGYEEAIAQESVSRDEKLQRYREQNILALNSVHGTSMPMVWMLGGNPDEQELTRRTIDILFGSQVNISTEPLPANTHGLRADLDHPEFTARKRFDERVKRWQSAAETIKRVSGERHIVVLICAPDRVGKKPEDAVNYYAGIHAMAMIGANVHHVLPIENPENPKSKQAFVHRVQSALLDVMLAHTGAVLGVREFVERLLPATNIPRAIYGVQAVRSRARSRSGQTGVNFVLYSRVVIATGMTDMRIGYCDGPRNELTPWMPLSAALSWTGSQRRLQEGDSQWLQSAFVDLTRRALAEIHQEDSRAIVLIEWESVRSLWKGIRDSDLGAGMPPRLDASNLAQFKDMTFIRLRRWPTLALRTCVQTTFKGWTENGGVRSETGEIKPDAYVTTDMRLVEIADGSHPDSRSCAHYVASMGYAKTVQVKRGFSCYRTMPRMSRIGDGSKEFEQTILDVASMDAALPAPMDVSVLSSPVGVGANLYAVLSMGLRLGYAHYNDWTSLPMPLFFRRKVEDYVIRYPDELEISTAEVEAPDDSGTPSNATVYTELVAQETEGVIEPPPVSLEITPDVLGALAQEGGRDLLSRVKSTPMPFIREHRDYQSRKLYQRMLNGGADVRVDLPQWVRPKGIFAITGAVTKRGVRQSWEMMRESGYVKSNTPMPRVDEYMDWLAAKLRIPQVCGTIVSATRGFGEINFADMVDVIERDFNTRVAEADQVTPFSIDDEMFVRLVKWADANRHDALMGWLIFMVAQLPNDGWPSRLTENLSSVAGPRTEQALHYYLATASAIGAVLEQRNNRGHFTVLRELPAPAVNSVTVDESASASLSAQLAESAPSVPASANPPPAEDSDRILATKQSLMSLMDQIEPGTEGFDAFRALIEEKLGSLAVLHQEKQQLNAHSLEMAESMSRLAERQGMLAQQINALNQLDRVSAKSVLPADLPTASNEVVHLEEAILDVSALLKQLNELETAPVATQLQERKRRKEVEQQITDSALTRIESIRSVIQSGICFHFDPSSSVSHEHAPDTKRGDIATPIAASPALADALPTLDPGTAKPLKSVLSSVDPATLEETPTCVQASSADGAAANLESHECGISDDASTTTHTGLHFQGLWTESSTQVQNLINPELEVDDPSIGAPLFEAQIPTLQKLLDRRLYALAGIHVTALDNLMEGFGEPELLAHTSILAALTRALDGMDCQSSYDTKVNSRLAEFLTAEKLPSGTLSDPAHMAFGILAASLGSMLFDDSDLRWQVSNAVAARVADYGALSSLLEHLDLIRQRGLVLTRDLFVRSHIGDKNALERELTRFRQRAQAWTQEPDIHSGFNHRGFLALQAELFGPRHPIGKCLAIIAKGETTSVAVAYNEARRKFEKPAQTVDELFKRVGERTKPQGLYRVQAIENIAATETFVASYVDLIARRGSETADLSRNTQSFLDGLNRKLNDAIAEIKPLAARTPLEALYRDAARKALKCVVSLFDPEQAAVCIATDKQTLLMQTPMGLDRLPALSRPDRLTPPLCTPADVFEETRRIADDELTHHDPSSESHVDKALGDAYQGHLTAKRFLPAFWIERILTKPNLPRGQTLSQQWAKERDTLAAELQEARQRVAHAMTLSALPQDETNRMQWLIEELLRLCRSEGPIGTPAVQSSTYHDFPQARAALRFNVLQPLETHLSKAKAKLEFDLEEEKSKGLVPAADVARIKSMLESSNAATLRTAYDSLAMLRQSGKLPARLLTDGNLAEEYDRYLDHIRKSTGKNKHVLDEVKRLLEVERPERDEPDWLAPLDAERRREALELLSSWVQFFKARDPGKRDLTERLFRAMGFTVTPEHYQEHSRSNRARFLVDDKTFQLPTAADDPMFIPPILGSWAMQTQCYALFGAIQENDIRQLTQEIGSAPTWVLSRSNLNMERRASVSGNSPVLLIDDDLMVYAALHPGEQLQSLIKVSMLTFTTNPYDDYNTKPVPSEMFFGRKEELDRLRGVKGLAVLYGGRRLGKSSLLNQIEQESRNAPGYAAIYISMDTINTSGNYVLSAWEFIYRALVNRRIIESMGPLPSHWKAVAQHVEKQLMDGAKVRALFLLLDEADNLMGCELRRKRDDDSFVRSLTQLSDNVARTCHVRMVITGLHNVTRMANDENSVFGKAEPIPLKPFSSADDVQRGIRLITKPLAAMGYLFGPGAEDLPLRILSVCNFYPAFVQLYCKRLVEHLQNNRQDKKPPYFIGADVLDVVEKDNNLMSELREKFKLNLNLDKRYKAIVMILADAYYSEVEAGPYSGLTAAEIRDYCEVYCGQHFENTGPGVYEALLDEMSKLNVIEKVGSRYVLRNPNIAMMVGDRDRITTLINELANEPPETSRNQGERRILMTKGNSQMVFPMPMSWIRNHMDASDGELLILTGNALSGIIDLSMAERGEWRLQDGVFMSVPGNSPQNLADQVARHRRVSHDSRAPRIMSVRNAAWRIDQIPEYASIANKSGRAGIRTMLLAHPERALELAFALESGQLKPAPDASRSWRVVSIPQWSEDAIYYWLHEDIEVAENHEAIASIRTATCGFGKQVSQLCVPNITREAALAFPETQRPILAPNLSMFYQHIGMPPSILESHGEAIKNFLGMLDGTNRSQSSEIEEYMQTFGVSAELFQFLYWMGLVQEGTEHRWVLPKLYSALIA